MMQTKSSPTAQKTPFTSIEKTSSIPVISFPAAKTLFGLDESPLANKTAEQLDALFTSLETRAFKFRPSDADALRDTDDAMRRILDRETVTLQILSLETFYTAPSWMPLDSPFQMEYRELVNTQWFERSVYASLDDHLATLFGLHAFAGSPEFWNAAEMPSGQLVRAGALLRENLNNEDTSDIRAKYCVKTLVGTARIAINLARRGDFGSLAMILPLLELIASGALPIGFRKDNAILAFFA